MFILAEAGVFCVCKQRQMWSIRSMRDAGVGIPWIGSGAAEKAAFMLVREVSNSADMMLPGQWVTINILREQSRDRRKRYSY